MIYKCLYYFSLTVKHMRGMYSSVVKLHRFYAVCGRWLAVTEYLERTLSESMASTYFNRTENGENGTSFDTSHNEVRTRPRWMDGSACPWCRGGVLETSSLVWFQSQLLPQPSALGQVPSRLWALVFSSVKWARHVKGFVNIKGCSLWMAHKMPFVVQVK